MEAPSETARIRDNRDAVLRRQAEKYSLAEKFHSIENKFCRHSGVRPASGGEFAGAPGCEFTVSVGFELGERWTEKPLEAAVWSMVIDSAWKPGFVTNNLTGRGA